MSDPSQPAPLAEHDPAFVKFVKLNEGGHEHFKNGRYMPYKDHAGKWTIGIGHLINGGKSDKGFEKGITPEQAQQFFRSDLSRAASNVRAHTGADQYEKLDKRQKQMLIDFAFNLGPQWYKKKTSDGRSGFPKFTAAVLANDMDAASREARRVSKNAKTGVMEPLTQRNTTFRTFFGLPTPPPTQP